MDDKRRQQGGDSYSRGRFLERSGAAGIAVLGGTLWATAPAAARARRPGGNRGPIRHLIISCQENRSFDHYFGTYSGVEGFGNTAAKAIFEQEGYPAPGYEGKLLPFRLDVKAQCFPDITHSGEPQHRAWNGGAMDKIVRTHV
jgi:phospholipase C